MATDSAKFLPSTCWRYVLVFLTSVALPLVAVAAFVIAVDPYFIFGSPGWRGFNARRSISEMALAKPYLLRQFRPAAVSMGSSRVEVGIDPRHTGWTDPRVFNLGLPGATSYDVMLAYFHAHSVGRPLKQAVIGLDFFGFNIFFKSDNSEREERFDDDGRIAAFADFLDAEMTARGHGAIAARTVDIPDGSVKPPADWDEANYLARNPMARIRIARGTFANGYPQYLANGSAQGLSGGLPPADGLERLRALSPSFSRHVFQFQELFGTVYSRIALGESVLTVLSQNKPMTFDRLGMRVWEGQAAVLRSLGGTGKLFDDMLQAKSWVLWLPPPALAYCFTHPDTGASMFDPFRFMLRQAYADNVDIRLFVTPLQAAVRESFVALGLGNRYAYWLSELTRINEQEAARAKRQPFSLWDFSDVNAITSEEMPAPSDPAPMTWFWEYSHYRKVTGDLILDRIFGVSNPALPLDFGVALNGHTIDAHLAQSESRLAGWRAAHGALAARITQAAQSPDAQSRQRLARCW